MKVVQINTTCGVGSTGKICTGISKVLWKKNIENYILYSSSGVPYAYGIPNASPNYIKLQALKSRALGNYGFNSDGETRRMITQMDRIEPDVVHLHNIHSHDCNLEMLSRYLHSNNIKVVWTFHDCWAFTGYCCHFSLDKCEKWKTECSCCPQYRTVSLFRDRSTEIFRRKKQALADIDLHIVTPSKWLSGLVKQSFLREYPISVINNGIDLSIFKPTEGGFRSRYHIGDKPMILAVAMGWGYAKGLDVVLTLADRLGSEYCVVLVGRLESADLPDNVISIQRTQNQQELAEIYTAADVFVNPTRVDTYPTVNMEAIACGTPVVTFETGGSPEIIDPSCGISVPCDDLDALQREVEYVCRERPFSKGDCIKKAVNFDMYERFQEYARLYQTL